MAAAEENGLDGWLIGELRSRARPVRIDDLLLDGPRKGARLACRVEALERELELVRARVGRAERRLDGSSVHHAAAHTRFVPAAAGYEVVEADGPPPRAGEVVVVGDEAFRVLRAGRSPLPFDRRPCVFLVRA